MIFSTTSQDRHRRRHQARQDHLQGAQRPHSRFQPVPAKGARSLDPDPRSDDSRLSRARRRRSISRHRATITSAELFSGFARSPHPPRSDPTITPPFSACCDNPRRVFFFWSRVLALRLFLPREARSTPPTSTDVALPRRVFPSRVTRSASRTSSARSARRLSAPRRRLAAPPPSPRWSLSTPSPT